MREGEYPTTFRENSPNIQSADGELSSVKSVLWHEEWVGGLIQMQWAQIEWGRSLVFRNSELNAYK